MKSYFVYRESSNKVWTICPVHKEFIGEEWSKPIRGSFNLLACRISGLSWPQWLRYCRQNGATIYGKNAKYPVAIWKEPNKDFLNMLSNISFIYLFHRKQKLHH
jgi:hypothetical protein